MSRGHRLLFPNQILFFFEDRFVLSNSVDPDEMPYYAGCSLFTKLNRSWSFTLPIAHEKAI